MFYNILIPVSLNKNTDSAIDKAIRFANQLECHLHLLHIIEPPAFSLTWLRGALKIEKSKGDQLLEWRNQYAKRLRPGLKLFATVQEGDAAKLVSRYAEINDIDLVLTGDEPKSFLFFNSRFNISQLTRSITCPVLTIKPLASSSAPFKTIVLPVSRFIPINKIRTAIYLARQFKAAIHLLALENNGRIQQEELACIKKTFRVLKDNTDIPVACNTMTGESLASIAIKYAHSLGDGLIVVNPGAESQLSGFSNHQSSESVLEEPKVFVVRNLESYP